MKKKENKQSYPPVFLTIWQDAWTAIAQPKQYVRWAFQPLSRSLKYLVFLNAVLAIVSTAYFFITLKPALLNLKDWVHDTVPPITLEQGVLTVEDDQALSFTDSDRFFFKLDPTQAAEDDPSIDQFYEVGVLLTRDGIILKDGDQQDTLSYADLGIGPLSFDGPTLAGLIDTVLLRWSFLFVPFIVFLYLMLVRLLFTLFFSVVFYVFGGMKFDLTQLWSMAIYALTPAIVAGYISFMFNGPSGLFSLVFLIYFFLGYANYLRFKMMKTTLKS